MILYQRITCNNVLFCVTISLSPFITAHKRRLRRLCFHRCLSVHGRGEHCMLGYTPPSRQSPGRHLPLGRHAPLGRHPPRQTPHLPSACWDTHTPVQSMLGYTFPCAVHAGIRSTSRWYASHWNAFLFINYLHKLNKECLSVLCRASVTHGFCCVWSGWLLIG